MTRRLSTRRPSDGATGVSKAGRNRREVAEGLMTKRRPYGDRRVDVKWFLAVRRYFETVSMVRSTG